MGKKPKKKLTPYNLHVQKQMKAGKSMKQAAASWSKKDQKPKASAAKPSSKTRSSSKKSTGGRSTVAKNNGFNTQKIFKYMRIGALALPAAEIVFSPGTIQQKAVRFKRDYFGVGADGVFNWGNLSRGWMPFIASSLITIGVPKVLSMIRRG